MTVPDASSIESIAENLRTTLDAMKAGATYNYTPSRSTSRESVDYSSLNTFPCYEVIVGPETMQYFGKRVVNYITFYIRGYHSGEKGMGTSYTKQTNMVQDVKTAILTDISRGEFAANTEIVNVESDEGLVAPYIVMQMTLRVTYLSLDADR